MLERQPRELSGGQRQRVAMGRAIVRQPAVFLFDEPLSNLDAKLRAQTRLEIQKLHRELGITSLFVTHDQVEAMTLAQRMMVMNAGRMEQFGTPEEVYQRPASTFVAGFIGSPPMNLLRGQADGSRFTHRRPDPAAAGGGAAQRRTDPRPAPGTRQLGPDGGGGLGAAGGRGRNAGCRAAGVRPAGRRRCSPCASTACWRRRVPATACRWASRPSGCTGSTPAPASGIDMNADWPYPLWIAHRGAGKLAPENTLAAFRLGAQLRLPGLRMRRQAQRRRRALPAARRHAGAHHRPGRALAGERRWAELSQLDAGSWHSRLHAGEPLPTLGGHGAFLQRNGFALNIEIKPTPGTEAHTGAVVAARGGAAVARPRAAAAAQFLPARGLARRARGRAGVAARAAARHAWPGLDRAGAGRWAAWPWSPTTSSWMPRCGAHPRRRPARPGLHRQRAATRAALRAWASTA